jgi:hypothetical protein
MPNEGVKEVHNYVRVKRPESSRKGRAVSASASSLSNYLLSVSQIIL